MKAPHLDELRLPNLGYGDLRGRAFTRGIVARNRGTVTAEAWRPDELRLALRQGAPECAATRHHTWRYDEGCDGTALDGEIVKTVLSWVATRLQPPA